MSLKWFTKKRLLIIGAVVVVLLVVVVIVSKVLNSGDELSVREVRSQGSSLIGQDVRVGGQVARGSVQTDPRTGMVLFTLTQGTDSVQVAYDGRLPDSFRTGSNIYVEGQYAANGTIQADKLDNGRSAFCNICH